MEVTKEKIFGKIKLRLARGDITKSPTEAIVNAANKYLEHGGGVALAIAKACSGDPSEYTKISKEQMKKQVGRSYIEHGEVVVTPGLNLEKRGIRYVIHTVGPICSGKWDPDLKEKLYKALRAPLEKADELKLSSIAFPAVSAGIYGCPLTEVVKTLIEVVEDVSKELRGVREVYLVLYDEKSVKEVEHLF